MTPSRVASYSRNKMDSCLFSCASVRFSRTSLAASSSRAEVNFSVRVGPRVQEGRVSEVSRREEAELHGQADERLVWVRTL